MTALTASGSSRLFPDPLGCFRISRSWRRNCRASTEEVRVHARPRPRAPPPPPSFLRSAVPGSQVLQTPSKFFSSKASSCRRVTLEAVLRLHLLRDARRPQPKEGEALALSPVLGPWRLFRWSLAHGAAKCGPASPHPALAERPSGQGWVGSTFWAREPRVVSRLNLELTRPHPHFDIQPFTSSC